MKLLPVDIDMVKNEMYISVPDCMLMLEVYPEFYKRVGFDPPWIGYFLSDDSGTLIGGGGFKVKPIDGKVEIAYGVFKNQEGKGWGTEICKILIDFARSTDPAIGIIAQTLPENGASQRILEKNGFVYSRELMHEEDGLVWEWEYRG